MTTKIFWQDPYLTELTTTIATVSNNQITVSETIFYAFSGGQESDAGTINNHEVLHAQKNDLKIYYTLPDNHNLKVNDTVTMRINWPRCYKLMRLHFAAKIILELMYKKLPDIEKVDAHINEKKVRIDFKSDISITPFLDELQQAAQSLIDAHHPITSNFSDPIKERRYWKIDAFSSAPCGGTHIKNTSEIGDIKLKRVNPGKGLERIEIYIPEKA